jgi:hypothetical protein
MSTGAGKLPLAPATGCTSEVQVTKIIVTMTLPGRHPPGCATCLDDLPWSGIPHLRGADRHGPDLVAARATRRSPLPAKTHPPCVSVAHPHRAAPGPLGGPGGAAAAMCAPPRCHTVAVGTASMSHRGGSLRRGGARRRADACQTRGAGGRRDGRGGPAGCTPDVRVTTVIFEAPQVRKIGLSVRCVQTAAHRRPASTGPRRPGGRDGR